MHTKRRRLNRYIWTEEEVVLFWNVRNSWVSWAELCHQLMLCCSHKRRKTIYCCRDRSVYTNCQTAAEMLWFHSKPQPWWLGFGAGLLLFMLGYLVNLIYDKSAMDYALSRVQVYSVFLTFCLNLGFIIFTVLEKTSKHQNHAAESETVQNIST